MHETCRQQAALGTSCTAQATVLNNWYEQTYEPLVQGALADQALQGASICAAEARLTAVLRADREAAEAQQLAAGAAATLVREQEEAAQAAEQAKQKAAHDAAKRAAKKARQKLRKQVLLISPCILHLGHKGMCATVHSCRPLPCV